MGRHRWSSDANPGLVSTGEVAVNPGLGSTQGVAANPGLGSTQGVAANPGLGDPSLARLLAGNDDACGDGCGG